MEGKAGLLRGAEFTGNDVVEVDHFAPVEPGVDIADLAACVVRGDVRPVPVWKILELQPSVVVAGTPHRRPAPVLKPAFRSTGPDQYLRKRAGFVRQGMRP